MQKYILEKAFGTKLFMLLAFSMGALVMYQGHISTKGIYTILFIAALLFCAFQIASTLYVIFIKRTFELSIDENTLTWKFYDNKKLSSEQSVKLDEIKEVKTEVNYLTGNYYSSFTTTFILKNDEEISFTDGLLYDFGLKKAESICRFLLENELGDSQDVKFAKLIKEQKIDLSKEQIFTKKDGSSYFIGVISKNKKEFLGLRLQIESLYLDYKDIEKNANNEFKVSSQKTKDSYIFLKSNAFGYFIEFYNVSKKEELKMLKDMGRQKFSF